MDKEHRVSVYDMVKELNLKEVTPEINSKEVYIEQAEINRYKQEAASLKKQLEEKQEKLNKSSRYDTFDDDNF